MIRSKEWKEICRREEDYINKTSGLSPMAYGNKYHNTKVIYNGIKFDSKKEKSRYIELKQLEKAGIIKELELQPKFLLLDTIHYKDITYPKTYYKADFKYKTKDGVEIIEDVKSKITSKDKTYRLKIKMLLTKYPDIDFVEVI